MVVLNCHARRMAALGVVWAMAAGSALGQGSANAQALPKADVVAALKDRERRIKSFSVALGVEVRESTQPSRNGDGVEDRARVGELSFLCDGPRTRVESKLTQSAGEGALVVDRMLAVIDGEATRLLQGSGDAWAFAAIQPIAYGLPVLLDPRDYLTQVGSHEVLSTMVRSATFASVKSRWQGDTQLLEIAPPPKRYIDNSREKWSVTLDVTRGFAFTHFERYRAAGLNAPWVKATQVAAGEFIEAAPGVWVPTVARREETYQMTDETSQGRAQTLVRHIEVDFKDWKINPRLDADAFVLDFPSDIEVQDELAPYNEEKQKRQRKTAAVAQPLLPLFAMRSPTVGIWMYVGVTVALAALVVFRRRARVASTANDRP